MRRAFRFRAPILSILVASVLAGVQPLADKDNLPAKLLQMQAQVDSILQTRHSGHFPLPNELPVLLDPKAGIVRVEPSQPSRSNCESREHSACRSVFYTHFVNTAISPIFTEYL